MIQWLIRRFRKPRPNSCPKCFGPKRIPGGINLQPDWRPGKNSTGPIKVCSVCFHWISLTPAEFYAQFGRMP